MPAGLGRGDPRDEARSNAGGEGEPLRLGWGRWGTEEGVRGGAPGIWGHWIPSRKSTAVTGVLLSCVERILKETQPRP